MSKFRTKPVVIEAFQVGSSRFYPEWLHEAVSANVVITYAREGSDGWKEPFDHADIQTLEGVMRADRGDWIIRGVEGELYPCKDSIFRQTYEPAEDGETPTQQPMTVEQIVQSLRESILNLKACPESPATLGAINALEFQMEKIFHSIGKGEINEA